MEINVKTKFNARRYFQVLGITLGVMLIGTLACLGINYSAGLNGEEVDNTSTVEAYGGKINVLLMCTDVDGLRTDAIMLASYDTESGQVKMLSIPRDTKVFVGNRYQKINAAHAYMKNGVIGGPTATCEAVNRITGIPINYYVDFSFDAVAHVVDELGPIDFTIPDLYGDGVGMVYDDPVQSLHIDLPPGDYKLNGQQAVWVMRYRHGNPIYYNEKTGKYYFKGYPEGDKGRIEMQQKLIKAIVDQKVNAAMILKVPAIFQAITSEIKTNFTAKDIIKYSKYLTNFSSKNIESYELPGNYGHDSSNGDVWEVDLDKTKELVQTVFGYDAEGITIENPNDKSSGGSSQSKSDSSKEREKKASSSSSSSETKQSKSSSSSSSSGSSSSGTSSGSSSSKSSSSGSSSSASSGKSQSSSSASSGESSSSGSSSSSSSGGSLGGSSAVKTKDLDDE